MTYKKTILFAFMCAALGSASVFADPLLKQGDQIKGRLFIDGVDQNKTCTLQVLSASGDSQRGHDCYNYVVHISEVQEPMSVSSLIYKMYNEDNFCDSAHGNLGDFDIESDRTNKHLIIGFDSEGKLQYYNLAKLTGIFSTTIYRCELTNKNTTGE